MSAAEMPGVPLPLSGETRLYAILGDPIAQVGSPRLFNSSFRRRGSTAVLVPMHVAPTDLAAVVTAFRSVQNFDGLVVTVPHKIDIAGLLDEVGPMAARIGAVNAILKTASGRLLGENFDGAGFIQGLAKHGHSLAGKKVLVIGAGGAGRAVAHAIVDRGPAELALFDIDATRSAELATELTAFGHTRVADGPHASGFDVAVNCTSIGMKPDDHLPCSLDGLSAGGLVVDIVLKPPRTRFLEEAEARGFAIVEGIHMLEGQIEVICDFFGLQDPAHDASA